MSRNTAASYLSSTNLVILPPSLLLFHTTYPRCLLIHHVETLRPRSHCFLPHCIHLDQNFVSLGLQYSSNQPVVVRLPQSRRRAFVSCTCTFCHAYSSSLLYSGTPTHRASKIRISSSFGSLGSTKTHSTSRPDLPLQKVLHISVRGTFIFLSAWLHRGLTPYRRSCLLP